MRVEKRNAWRATKRHMHTPTPTPSERPLRSSAHAPRRPLIAVLASAARPVGCGGQGSTNTDSTKDFTGEQKAVATTVEDLQTAAREKDGKEICADLITAELRDQISASNCGEVVKDAIRETDEVDLTVTAVTISGTTPSRRSRRRPATTPAASAR